MCAWMHTHTQTHTLHTHMHAHTWTHTVTHTHFLPIWLLGGGGGGGRGDSTKWQNWCIIFSVNVMMHGYTVYPLPPPSPCPPPPPKSVTLPSGLETGLNANLQCSAIFNYQCSLECVRGRGRQKYCANVYMNVTVTLTVVLGIARTSMAPHPSLPKVTGVIAIVHSIPQLAN